jgi:folate-binding protein YgfZ
VREPFAAWIERDVVRASGPETVAFLQGQLSQDVESLAVGGSAWSLLLQPSGKVDSWLRATRVEDDVMVLDVDGGWGDALIERLERFKLRTKCELERVEGPRCLAVRNVAVARPAPPPSGLPIVWPGTDGYDLLGPDVAPPNGIRPTDDAQEAYERARIEAGVPALGRELTDTTIPVEAGQWLIDASVSFTKGCFTGQELVARIDSRGGNAPRPVRGLRIAGAAHEHDDITVDGKSIGTITSASDTVALAPLTRTVAIGIEVKVGADQLSGVVVALPMA